MEVLASSVGAMLAEPCRALFTCLLAKLKNPFRFPANLRDLDTEMEVLIQRRDQLSQRLQLVAQAGLREPSEVKDWLRKVNTLEARVLSLKQDLDSSDRNSELSCCLRCSRLSDHVAIRLGEARQLTSDREMLDGTNIGPDPTTVRTEHMPAPAIEDQATASRNMAKVMDLLRREDVQRIGIWGMGGVGKTTLVQNVNNKLGGLDSFNIVMWITVSNRYQETESDLRKIQNLIAKRLKLELPEESMETRTSQLRARLIMEKTFLLILDDVWNPIDLDRLGIPQPQVLRGGKIILTTRCSYVCSQMADVPLKIEALNADEAWSLFCKSAGEVATWEEIEPLAKAITEECGGLPLAINVVGASLKRKRMVEVWKDALNALRRSEPPIGSGLEDKVYNPIKWSYDLLPNECIKSCFLFCCLFPEDYSIEMRRLVTYWLAEGLLEEHHDFEEVSSRGITIIETLKDRSLLEPDRSTFVRIHDIIRDVSIWISSLPENESRSLVRSGIGLEEMREDGLSVNSYNRVSFMCNRIRKLPGALQKCPTVVSLLLQENRELEHIPDDFLPAFKSLKILDLSQCDRINSLPPSLDQLGELRLLLLEECFYLETLPPVGGLAKLQVLDCSHTKIAALPQGMEKLSSLRQLKLNSCNGIKSLPPCLDQLGELRRLLLESCENLETLPPVGGLAKLQVLVCTSTKIAALPQGMEKLTSLRRLALSCNPRLADIPVGLMSGLSNLEELYLTWNDQWKFIGENGEILSQLREIMSLKRLSCLHIELGSSACTLETTDSLLNWTKNLNQFIFSFGATGIFVRQPVSKYKTVIFKNIHLWGERIQWLFANMTQIHFDRCKRLNTMFEKLIANRGEVGCFNTVKSLDFKSYTGSFGVESNAKLDMLPNLETIYLYDVTDLSSLSTLASQLGLKFSKLRIIEVVVCQLLKYLISIGNTVLSLEKLESIEIKSCERVEEVCKFDQNSSLQDYVFPNLRRITLDNCPALRYVSEQSRVACPCLEEVSVRKCPLLKKLPLTAQNVGTIKTIRGEQEWWDELEWENDGIRNAIHPCFRPRIYL